jgi:hypothetical protein
MGGDEGTEAAPPEIKAEANVEAKAEAIVEVKTKAAVPEEEPKAEPGGADMRVITVHLIPVLPPARSCRADRLAMVYATEARGKAAALARQQLPAFADDVERLVQAAALALAPPPPKLGTTYLIDRVPEPLADWSCRLPREGQHASNAEHGSCAGYYAPGKEQRSSNRRAPFSPGDGVAAGNGGAAPVDPTAWLSEPFPVDDASVAKPTTSKASTGRSSATGSLQLSVGRSSGSSARSARGAGPSGGDRRKPTFIAVGLSPTKAPPRVPQGPPQAAAQAAAHAAAQAAALAAAQAAAPPAGAPAPAPAAAPVESTSPPPQSPSPPTSPVPSLLRVDLPSPLDDQRPSKDDEDVHRAKSPERSLLAPEPPLSPSLVPRGNSSAKDDEYVRRAMSPERLLAHEPPLSPSLTPPGRGDRGARGDASSCEASSDASSDSDASLVLSSAMWES